MKSTVNSIVNQITSENELSGTNIKLLSLLCLIAAVCISFGTYTIERTYWFDTTLEFTPTAISSVLALCVVSPLYHRGILRWKTSVYNMLFFVLVVSVVASFISLALGGNGSENVVYVLIVLSVVLSFVGIKIVAAYSWVLAFTAAVYSLAMANEALGTWGYAYIITGFTGILLHTGKNPDELMNDFKEEYKGKATAAKEKVMNDLSSIR